MMVLLEFLEQIEARDDDLFAIERNAKRICSQSYFLDSTLMVTDEAADQILSERYLRHHVHLTWIIQSWNKNPFSMIPKIVEVPVSDNIAKLLEIASNLLK